MERLLKLLRILNDKGLDGYFISSVSNITYLTGFSGDSSRLMVSNNKIVLITDGRYTEQAQNECPKEVEILNWIENKRYSDITYMHVINVAGIKNLGFEGGNLSFSEYETLKAGVNKASLHSVTGLVESIRQQKDPKEIEYLRTACEISDKALELTLPSIKEGITELGITALLEYHLKMNGAENLSFESLILSGARTSLLHGKPSTKQIEKGDLILFDFGALYKGYHADISRSFVFGEASDQQKEVYEIIRKAQQEAVDSLRPGISVKVPDDAVRRNIPGKYLPYYYPGLGHGVGLDIHEQPFLGQAYESQLQENMVITIEPGIYIPGWGGIRIEDSLHIKQNGAVSLSGFPRELRIL